MPQIRNRDVPTRRAARSLRSRSRLALAGVSAALALAVPALASAAANPMTFDYGNSSALSAYAKPTGMVVVGRNFADTAAIDRVQSGGGEVLMYVDLVEGPGFNVSGDQADLYGGARLPAQYTWSPLRYNFSNYPMTDLRPGSAWIQHVVAYMRDWFPTTHAKGLFLDVMGTRLWSGAWSAMSQSERDAWTAGNYDLIHRLRAALGPNVILVANNGWPDGNPDLNGITIEHHAYSEASYWSGQTGRADWTKPVRNIVIASSTADATKWAGVKGITHVSAQSTYDAVASPILPFSQLPSTGTATPTPDPAPAPTPDPTTDPTPAPPPAAPLAKPTSFTITKATDGSATFKATAPVGTTLVVSQRYTDWGNEENARFGSGALVLGTTMDGTLTGSIPKVSGLDFRAFTYRTALPDSTASIMDSPDAAYLDPTISAAPAPAPPPPPASNPTPTLNLLANPSFENGLSPWTSWQGTLTAVTLSGAVGAPDGSKVGQVRFANKGTSYTVGNFPGQNGIDAGTKLKASALVRAATGNAVNKPATLYLREWTPGGQLVQQVHGASVTLSGTAFRSVDANLTVKKAGDRVDIFVAQDRALAGDSIYADGFYMVKS
jgi:hypothetical protein